MVGNGRQSNAFNSVESAISAGVAHGWQRQVLLMVGNACGKALDCIALDCKKRSIRLSYAALFAVIDCIEICEPIKKFCL
jgi:hypothetical protein